jgi:hypothetical protein
MDKIPYTLFDGFKEMVAANVMLASMFNARPLKGLASITNGRWDRKGYLVVRFGMVKYSFQGTPWQWGSSDGVYEEIPLKVNLEND